MVVFHAPAHLARLLPDHLAFPAHSNSAHLAHSACFKGSPLSFSAPGLCVLPRMQPSQHTAYPALLAHGALSPSYNCALGPFCLVSFCQSQREYGTTNLIAWP